MLNRYISVKLGMVIILLVISILVPLSLSIHQFFVRFYIDQTVSTLMTHGKYVEKMIRGKELADPSIKNAAFFKLMGSDLVLLDDRYRVVLNTGVPMLKPGDTLEEEFSTLLNQDQEFHHQMDEWTVVGIPVKESKVRSILLYAPKQPITDAVNEIERMILLSGFGAVLLTIGLTWLLSRRLVNPLLAMKEAAQILSKGDFKVKIPVNGKDEIAQLGEAINHLANDLHRLQTSRKEFLSNVSHELRTPLSYVKGYSQALDEGMLKTEEDHKKYIKVIRQEADRLARLVDDLFDLTQMDEGQLRLSEEQVDLDEIVRKMIQTVDPRAQAKNITLHYQKNDPLLTIEGDYGRLSQVLFNLLDNAIRHTPEEGEIAVTTRVQNDHVKLVVQDSGSGIPEKELPYVWERFYRVDKSRARQLGGTGLGLAIVKQIVEGHQGSIALESKEEVGTTVTVTLPIPRKEEK
jgi:signal transduction histidine kinase